MKVARNLFLSLLAIIFTAAPGTMYAKLTSPITRSHASMPCRASALAAPEIVFGRSGGNIMPETVSIYASGIIHYTGAATTPKSYAISPLAVSGLQKLGHAENFWSMPTGGKLPHALPDMATVFITFRTGCNQVTKTSATVGSAIGRFNELYETLTAAAGLGL